MQRPTFLEYADFRYLKATAAAAAGVLVAWWAAKPPAAEAWGGSVFGYLLGIASTLLVFVLMWYGIRKRRFPRVAERRRGDRRKLKAPPATDAVRSMRERQPDRRKTRAERTWRYGGTLQGWLSAHVYLGLLLVLLSTLHAGFRWGWSVHGIAYLLVLLVVASGIYGVAAYFRFPRLITENLGESTLADLLARIDELDELARVRALGLPEEVGVLVFRARQGTRIGGGLFEQLRGDRRDCPTTVAAERVQDLGRRYVEGDQPRRMTDLYAVLAQKQRLVGRMRREIALQARMQVWLWIHVPLSIALPAAIFAHVAAILVYW